MMSHPTTRMAAALPLLLLFIPLVQAERPSHPNYINTTSAALRVEDLFEAYNLPYGTLGMVAHSFMLWYLACHLHNRRPLMPWRHLEYDLWNVGQTFVSSVVSIALAGVSLAKVTGSGALMTMAVGQIVFNLVVDGVNVHRWLRNRFHGDKGGGKRGLSWQMAPWLLGLMVMVLVTVQALGTLEEIDRNARLDGVVAFDIYTKETDTTGVVFVVLATVGGVLAFVAPVAGAVLQSLCCVGRREDGSRRRVSMVYVFVFFGLISCFGWLLAVDYAVGVVTGNYEGSPGKVNGSAALYWTFFVFQYVPLFTF